MTTEQTFVDERGKLRVIVPDFTVRRAFVISDVPPGQGRGGHAHRTCEQLLVVVLGYLTVNLETPGEPPKTLSMPGMLLVKPMTWLELGAFSRDAIVLVLCSDAYDPGDYIRDKAEWRAECTSRSTT